jgi:hypothetical protein
MLFGGCLLVVCAAVMGVERKPLSFLSPEAHRELRELEGPAKTVLEARQLGEVLYFFEVPEPMERGPSVEEDGRIWPSTCRAQ